MAKKNTNNFEQQMKRLQEIVEQLEKEDIDLDSSLNLYQEGLTLSKNLKAELNKFEDKINKIAEEQDE